MPDVVVEADGGRLHFRHLEWDTAFFGRPSYILDPDRSSMRASALLGAAASKALRGAFATVRVDSAADPAPLLMLQSNGFYYVDTSVTLRLDPNAGLPALPDDLTVRVEELVENRNLPYQELGSVFTMTRFHFDPHVGKERADKLWVEYLRNFRLSASARLFAAYCDESVAGAMTVVGRGESMALSFVSVLDAHRGRHVGARILRAIGAACGSRELLTETQIRNVAALNFYVRNGFRQVRASRTVLHFWG